MKIKKELIEDGIANLAICNEKDEKGVCANRFFHEGEGVAIFTGARLDFDDIEEGSYTDRHALQIGRGIYLGPSGSYDDFFNHSCDPNAGIREEDGIFALYAMRDIREGEEITWDYSTYVDEEGWEMKCECGSEKCRGRITSFRHLPMQLQEEYIQKGIVPYFIRESYFDVGM